MKFKKGNYGKTLIGITGLVFLLVLFLSTMTVLAYQQSPMLDEKVEKGEIEPVDQRLPKNPHVVEVEKEIGDYGGEWDILMNDQSQTKWIGWWSTNLMKWNRKTLEPVPELAKELEISDDSTTFTIHLREGLRWSDGEEFNADDFVFWYEDISKYMMQPQNKDGWFKRGDEYGKIKKIDDYTIEVSFAAPHPRFEYWLCNVNRWLYAPEHYLKQFHPKYVDEDKINQMVEDDGFDSWENWFNDNINTPYQHNNPDLPTMNPWVLETEKPAEIFKAVRNPYYFKVDENGNQLPYIDSLELKLVQNIEVLNMQAISGKADLQVRRLSTENYSLYMNNREEGNYEVLTWDKPDTADPALYFNYNTKDEVLKEIVLNSKFRKALSIGINREEINQVVYKGLGTPMQATVAPQFKNLYKEEYAQAYTEYNPEKANEMLDEMGLDEKDSSGYRLRPDGKRLMLTIFDMGEQTAYMSVMEMTGDYFDELGIETNVKRIDRTLFRNQRISGDICTHINSFKFSPFGVGSIVPFQRGVGWSPQYGYWWASDGEEGEEPPAKIKELFEIYDKLLVTADTEKRQKLLDEILKSQAENIWNIGTVGLLPQPVIKKKYFHNVPKNMIYDFGMGQFSGLAEVSQFYIEKSAQEK